MPARKPMTKKPAKKRNPIDRFLALSDKEKARIADQYDAEFSIDELMDRMTPAQKTEYRRRMGVGRPQQGQGHKVISTSMEKGLLARLDAEAKRRGVARAKLLAEFAEKGLAKVG